MSELKLIVKTENVKIEIPYSELTLSYARSSGPGGQNVNKVNSKATLRWDAIHSPSLPPFSRHGILMRLSGKLTLEGELVVSSDRFRDQIRNREDCLEKLAEMVRLACIVPKARKKTKPSKSSRRKAEASKQKHSQKKRLRSAKHDHS